MPRRRARPMGDKERRRCRRQPCAVAGRLGGGRHRHAPVARDEDAEGAADAVEEAYRPHDTADRPGLEWPAHEIPPSGSAMWRQAWGQESETPAAPDRVMGRVSRLEHGPPRAARAQHGPQGGLRQTRRGVAKDLQDHEDTSLGQACAQGRCGLTCAGRSDNDSGGAASTSQRDSHVQINGPGGAGAPRTCCPMNCLNHTIPLRPAGRRPVDAADVLASQFARGEQVLGLTSMDRSVVAMRQFSRGCKRGVKRDLARVGRHRSAV